MSPSFLHYIVNQFYLGFRIRRLVISCIMSEFTSLPGQCGLPQYERNKKTCLPIRI